MVRLTFRAILVVGLAVSLNGCFRTTRVASVDRALALALPGERGHPAASAQVAADVGPTMTLSRQTALELAVANEPKLAELRATEAAAAARVAAANDLDDPELRLTKVDFKNGGDASELALRARPPMPGALRAKEQIAGARLEQARSAAARERQILVSRVQRLFDESLLHAVAVGLAGEAAALESRELALVDRELERALITRVDAAGVTMEMARERGRADRAARRLADSRDELLTLVGVPADVAVTFAGEPTGPAVVDALATADRDVVERTLRERPEIRAAGAAIDAASAETWLKRSAQWPWFSFVQLGYDFQPSGAEAWQAGVAIDVPLFALGGDDVRAAEAEAVAARRAFEVTVLEVNADVKKRLARARDAAATLERWRRGAATAAASAKRAAVAARGAGHAGERDLIEAETRDLEARLIELELREEYVIAYGELRTAIGEADETSIAATTVTDTLPVAHP